MTAGDAPDVLVALNPAALQVNLNDLKKGGLIIIDVGTVNQRNLRKAGFETNPLENGSLGDFQVFEIDVSRMTLEAVKESGLSQKDGLRCKNLWTLGLVYWLYDRDRQPTVDWLNVKFAKRPEIAAANIAALNPSGFLNEQKTQVVESMAASGLQLTEDCPREDWTTLVFQAP